MSFYVMLRHCLPEHEGRDMLCETYDTEAEAQAYIAKQEGEYFRPSDYYITSEIPIYAPALGNFLVTVGLPRSGKSTICRDVYKPLGYTVVCADDFHVAITGQRHAAKATPLIWACVHACVDALLLSGNRVILDSTNVYADRRAMYARKGAEFVIVDTPVEECLRRAEATHDDYIIPVIKSFAARWEPVEDWEELKIAAVHKWSRKT